MKHIKYFSNNKNRQIDTLKHLRYLFIYLGNFALSNKLQKSVQK